jgi:isopenicillin-N epimerase
MSSRSPLDHSPSINNLRAGREVFGEFELVPGLVHLNHGSFGAVPRSVTAEQERWRALIERDPTSFYTYELPGLMRKTAVQVARRFGGDAKDWVLCENATSAVNGVLASLPLKPGDEIVTTSHAYGAVLKAMKTWAERREARVVIADLPSVLQGDGDVLEAIAGALGPRTKLLVIDHITSATAIILPVRQIVDLAHKAGVPVLVDGAHAPGQVPLDVPGIGADWYTGNAHKWLFVPRGCGILWTAPSRQPETLPAILSHGTDQGYTEAFDWVGTRDVTPWLSFEAGALAHEAFGGAALMDRNRRLASEGANILAEALNAIPSAPPAMRPAMASLRIGDSAVEPGTADSLRQALVREYGVVAPVHAFDGNLWLRISAQVYNEIDDYFRCADSFLAAAKSLGIRA